MIMLSCVEGPQTMKQTFLVLAMLLAACSFSIGSDKPKREIGG